MMMCGKCVKIVGAIFLVLGVVFLLGDLGYWDFWNIEWYTALFIIVGVTHLASAGCSDCKALREGRKK